MYASYLVFIVRKRKFKSRANVYSLLVSLYSVSIKFSAKIKLDRLPTFANITMLLLYVWAIVTFYFVVTRDARDGTMT